MKVLIFASDSKYKKCLEGIHSELINKNHKSFFLYSDSNLTKYPTQQIDEYNYDYDDDYDFETGILSKSLGLPIPFIPDYLILARERWQPEQSIIQEFKELFNAKIVLVEVNSQFINTIETRLEMVSRKNYPQNMIDIIFDHSNSILETRKKALEWDKWENSFVVGNPCHDNFSKKVDDSICKKYNVDLNKQQILFFGLQNMDRKISFDLLKNLATNCGDDYQIFYKPFPGEPYDEKWKDDFKPKFLVDGVKVIYDHSDIFTMYNLCDIHIGVIGSAMYPSLMLNKKVVNINNFCRYLDRGNDIGVYLDEDTVGVGDGSAKFWMGVHGLGTVEEFKELVGEERVEKFKSDNKLVESIISECTYGYDMDLKFLEDDTPKDYTKLLNLFDEYNDGKASVRIEKILRENLC